MKHAFIMYLKKGCEEEYKNRHDALPEQLRALLKQYGICEYSIYLHCETGYLFAIMDIADDFDAYGLANSPIMQKWWQEMAPLMETEKNSNAPKVTVLEKMFYLP